MSLATVTIATIEDILSFNPYLNSPDQTLSVHKISDKSVTKSKKVLTITV